jgi:hypothetical protein
LALFCVVVAVGCSEAPPNATTADGGGAAGSAGAAASSGSGGAAGTGVAGSGGQALATSGSGGAPVCTSYPDQSGYNLVVHIENKTTHTLYLGQEDKTCPIEPLFEVQDGSRAKLPSLAACRTSCDTMMNSGPVACPLNCASPATTKLDPNQSLDIPWDGRFGVTQTLPQGCVANAAGPVTCVQAARIEPAIFTFSARAATGVQCLDPSGTCACMPSTTGGCVTASSVISGTVYTTEYLVKLEPGEMGTNGAPPYIGLVFKN